MLKKEFIALCPQHCHPVENSAAAATLGLLLFSSSNRFKTQADLISLNQAFSLSGIDPVTRREKSAVVKDSSLSLWNVLSLLLDLLPFCKVFLMG